MHPLTAEQRYFYDCQMTAGENFVAVRTYFIDLFEKFVEIKNKPESIQRFANMFVRITHDLLSAMNRGVRDDTQQITRTA